MTLLSLILALLIEQFQPLPVQRCVRAPVAWLARFLEERFNDGDATHGRVAWLLAVVPLVLGSAILYFLLWHLHPLLALVFNVAILYLTMGFRHESHYFTDIHLALRLGDLERARQLIGEWRGVNHDRASSEEIVRLAIEQALVSSHRQVFAVLFWFLILPGPAGALLYRLAERLVLHWGQPAADEFGEFGVFARRAFAVMDWIPVRVTAAAFSIVGDFEDAAHCWRTQSSLWPDHAAGILIASGAGALGVRLGQPVYANGEMLARPEMGVGAEADVEFMQSAVGLVWRSIVFWLLLLFLIGLARLAG